MLPQLGLAGTGLSQSLEWSQFTPGAELVWANIVKHPALQCVSNVCQQKYSYTHPSAAIYIYLKKKKRKGNLIMFMYSCSYLHERTNPTLKATAQDENKFSRMGRKKMCINGIAYVYFQLLFSGWFDLWVRLSHIFPCSVSQKSRADTPLAAELFLFLDTKLVFNQGWVTC